MSGSFRMMSSALIGDEAVEHPVIVLEQVLEGDQDVRLVVDDQDRAMRWVHLTRQGHATICLGIVMMKLAPPCGPASTVIDPLWA